MTAITIVLLFACLIAREYTMDLRRENKRLKSDNETAWRFYDNDHRELCAIKGLPVTAPYFSPEEDKNNAPPFSFSGIGITQIRDRELRKQREREAETQPRFDKSALSQPTEQEIIEAARLAASKPN